jgi:hypothetical protein
MGRRAQAEDEDEDEDEDEGEEGLECSLPVVRARVTARGTWAELTWESRGLVEEEEAGEEGVEILVEEKEREGIRSRSCW